MSPSLFAATIKEALLGSVLFAFPTSLALYYGLQYFGSDMNDPLPPVKTVALQVLAKLVSFR